jgi:hypothetical protein
MKKIWRASGEIPYCLQAIKQEIGEEGLEISVDIKKQNP